jgi:hypothetical protein
MRKCKLHLDFGNLQPIGINGTRYFRLFLTFECVLYVNQPKTFIESSLSLFSIPEELHPSLLKMRFNDQRLRAFK